MNPFIKLLLVFQLITLSYPSYSDLAKLISDSCQPPIDEALLSQKRKKHVMTDKEAQNCYKNLSNTWDQFPKNCQDAIGIRFFKKLKEQYRNPTWSYFEDGGIVFDAIADYHRKKFKLSDNPEDYLKGLGGRIHTMSSSVNYYEIPLNDKTKNILGLNQKESFKYGRIKKDLIESSQDLKSVILEYKVEMVGDKLQYRLISIFP